MRIYLRWLGARDPVTVTSDVLAVFKAHLENERRVGAKALMLYFSAMQSYHDYLIFRARTPHNPIPAFRRRYLRPVRRAALKHRAGLRQVLDIPGARRLVQAAVDPRDQAMLMVLLKTGARREELVQIDVDDIRWSDHSIVLKDRPKRTNTLVFFDDETARVLKRWLAIRTARGLPADRGPLFTSRQGRRLESNGVYLVVCRVAQSAGFHDPKGKLRDKFTTHACRHWFTNQLRRAGMIREHIAWLRGDAPAETIDIYVQVQPEVVRQQYLDLMPRLHIA